jgi:hypothetical protein
MPFLIASRSRLPQGARTGSCCDRTLQLLLAGTALAFGDNLSFDLWDDQEFREALAEQMELADARKQDDGGAVDHRRHSLPGGSS